MGANDFTIRINVNDGSLEISGPQQDWVDAKLVELTLLLGTQADASEPPTDKKRQPRRRGSTGTASGGPDAAARQPLRGPRSGVGGRATVNAELRDQFSDAVQAKFKAFVEDRQEAWDGSQNAQAAIIATFLRDELDFAGVDQHDLYTVYSLMGMRSPANIRSQLTNARQRARYFSGQADGKAVLSHAGENFARIDAKSGADEN